MALISSGASSTVSGTLSLTDWWLKDPVSGIYVAVKVASWQPVAKNVSGVFLARGRTAALVTRGELYAEGGPISIRVLDKANHDLVMGLLRGTNTLLLQNVLGEQWYVQAAGDITRMQIKSYPTPTETTPLRFAYEIQTELTGVAAP